MANPIRPRGPAARGNPRFPYNVPHQTVDNGPPVTPDPGPTSWIYQWEARTSNVTEYRFGGSCRGSQVIIPVGKCRVTAPMIGWAEEAAPTGNLHFAWCFGVGPAASITNWEISGTDEADVLPITMTTKCSTNVRLGTDTHVALSNVGKIWTDSGAAPPLFHNLIVTIGSFTKRNIGTIGLPTVQADLSMKSWDFRLGTPAYTENENPVLYLYTYLTKNPWGPRISAAEIDATSWGSAADWCDTDMDSGAGVQKRWRAGGVISGGDVTSAVQTLLQSAWCTMAWLDGKWHLIPFSSRNSSTPTEITADYIRRRRIGASRRPTVVHVNYRDSNNDYLDKQAIARSAGAVAGTARWVIREDSPPLVNAEDVAARHAATLLAAVSNSNRATVKVNHKDCPAVLDLKPGDNVRLSTWAIEAGTGGDDVWRVESLRHQELVTELELLGDEDALSTTLTTTTSGGTRTRVAAGPNQLLPNAEPIIGIDSAGVEHELLSMTSGDYILIGDPNAPVDEINLSATYRVHATGGAEFELDNNKYLKGRDGEGGGVTLIGLDSAETVQVGHASFETSINGSQITELAPLENALAIQAKETSGTARDLIKLNSSNEVELGDADNPLNLLGSRVDAVPPLANTVALQGEKVDGTDLTLAKVNASDEVELGSASVPLNILGTRTDALPSLANNVAIQGKETGGTVRNLALVNASNEVELGSADIPLNIFSTRVDAFPLMANNIGFNWHNAAGTASIAGVVVNADGDLSLLGGVVVVAEDYVDLKQDTRLANAKALEGTETGGTARDLIVLNASNDVIVGNATTDTKLYGNPITSVSVHRFGDYAGGNYTEIQTDGDILQAGTPTIENATRVVTPELRGREWRTTAVDTGLADNTNSILVRWDSSSGESVCLTIPYKVHVTYTISGVTYYFVQGGVITFVAVNVAGTTTRSAAISNVASVNTGAGTVAVTTTTGGGTNWGQVYVKADLSGVGTAWVSGHCEFHVLNSDTSNTALSNWAS